MASRLKRAADRGLIKCPSFVNGGVQYEVITGSVAYGCANSSSDEDIYGFTIPPRRIVFPHTAGWVPGFGTKPQGFDQFQQHHVIDKEAGVEYDFTIFNIVKYFQLTMMCNPNMIDTLFVPQRCVVHSTRIGNMVREKRKIFLNKKAFHTYKGYAYGQSRKMKDKHLEGLEEVREFKKAHDMKALTVPEQEEYKILRDALSKRELDVEKNGYSTKFLLHIIRLLLEIEQILIEGDLDLERNREQLKSIRNGEWTMQQGLDFFTQKERSLEDLYVRSELPHAPREAEVKTLLINCLEEHYGSLSGCVEKQTDANKLLDELEAMIGKYRC